MASMDQQLLAAQIRNYPTLRDETARILVVSNGYNATAWSWSRTAPECYHEEITGTPEDVAGWLSLRGAFADDSFACSICGAPTDFQKGCATAEWYLCTTCEGSPEAIAAGYTHQNV